MHLTTLPRLASTLALALLLGGCDEPTAATGTLSAASPCDAGDPAVTAADGTLALRPCAQYVYSSTGANLGHSTVTVQVDRIVGDKVYFRLGTQIGEGDPSELSQSGDIRHGVFFPYAASPVERDISAYPEERIKVVAGTFETRRVDPIEESGATYWFSGQVLVKSQAGRITTELSGIR